VFQDTSPVDPKPAAVAPDAKDTVAPHLPSVTVVASTVTVLPAPPPTVAVHPDLCSNLFTLIVLIIYLILKFIS
jgi:hypothetical protein